jgi:amidophosphoribosyltransferase
MGLVKNAYVGRTFIQPSQTIRQLGIRLKLNPLRDVVRGKRVVVVDDSIVRGNTQRAIVRMLREAGAIEVHVRISSPPVKWPCFYGIDFATRAELLANGLDLEGIRRSIGADTLGYVSLPGLIAATEQPKTRLCRACFDGEYPIELPADNVIGKHVLEGLAKTAAVASNAGNNHAQRRGPEQAPAGDNGRRAGTSEPAGDGARVAASPGAADALLRP